MRRFKSGWVLVAVAVLAICLAITRFSLDVPLRKVDQQGRNVEAERLSKRALPIKEKLPRANQSETAAILEKLARGLGDSGRAAQTEDPKTLKQPIRIKTH
jgi:HAMP domain-containing protein